VKNLAEFQLIGRVGAIKEVGSTMRITIASNYSLKDANGEWREDTYWNEITLFSTNIQGYVSRHIGKGDLVHARGRIRQNSYERNGERVYAVALICNDFSRLAQAPDNKADAKQPEPADPIAEDIPL
jgi:single-strand DNA-binding protein